MLFGSAQNGKFIKYLYFSSVQLSKQNLKGANESNLYKYMITIEAADQVDTAEYSCKVGDRETKGLLTVTKSKL